MYLALNAVTLAGPPAWPDFVRLASTTGFLGADVMLDPAIKAGADATRKLLESYRIRPAFLNLPVEFRKDDDTFRKTLPLLEEAAPFAAKIGCPRMMTYFMPSSTVPKDELRRTFKKRFIDCAGIMAKSNVRFGLEFLGPTQFRTREPHEFIWRMNEMLELAKECGPNVGLTLDAWHWHHAGGSIDDILNAGRDRIVIVHFDDAPNLAPDDIRDNERLLPGEGVINLTGFLQALDKIGYPDSLSIEVFGRGLKQMPAAESAKLCLEAGRKVFAKAGVRES